MGAWLIGLDVGQQHDYTAFAVIEERGQDDASEYRVRHLERFPLKLNYVRMVESLLERLEQMPIEDATLILDATGTGKPFSDYLRTMGIRPVEITVTAGVDTTRVPGGFHMPKVELITTMQLLLGSGRLRIAADLPEAKTLVNELVGYRRKITVALHTVFGAWREGQHDDLLFATGLACWYGERRRRGPRFEPIGR